MASEWLNTTLGALIDVKHGYAFPGDNIREEPPGDILLTPGNFAIGGGFKGSKFKYFDGPVPPEYVLQEGDLIVTMTDLSKQADTLGYPAVVPRALGPRFLHNQRLGKVLIQRSANLNLTFLFYLMRTADYRHEVLASATGTTVKHSSPSRILAYKVNLPPLPEQRAIAHILSALDDKIELNRSMNGTLEEMASALFKSWFVDFEPVRAKAEGRRPAGMAAEMAKLFPSEFEGDEPNQIPAGWATRSLYDSAKYTNGAAYRDFDFNPDGKGLPIIKIAELKGGITPQTKFTEGQVAEKYRIDTGSILFSWSGNPDTSIDTFVWTHGPAWLNQHIFKVEPNAPAERLYVFYLLKHLRPVFADIARDKQTTGLGHVTSADMKRMSVVHPPKTVLDKFNKIVAPIHDRWFGNLLEISSLQRIRDELLPKLVSGELRISNAERFLEGLR